MTQPGQDARLYPALPLLGVSIALFRSGEVLLIKRAKPPYENLFSLPGGLVERGERLEEAARRELWEEVEMRAGALRFNQHVEMIERDQDGAVRRHFVIATFTGLWSSGEGSLNDEVSEIVWTPPQRITTLSLTPGLAGVIQTAQSLVPMPLL